MATSRASERGLFALRTASDLRNKLRHDYRRVETAPADMYAAFDFFVTAEHLLDWVYPKKAGAPDRSRERKGSALLQICSHIASGAKHFEVEDPRHTSVSATEKRGGYFGSSYFGPRYFGRRYFSQSHLVVLLSGNAKARYGTHVAVLTLATQLVEFWNSHPDVK